MNMKCFSVLVTLTSLVSLPVSAHTGVSVEHGLYEGLVHPLIGLDHLLVMLGIGLWSVKQRHQPLWLLPIVFLLMMILGAAIQQAGYILNTAEVWVALSVLFSGWLVWKKGSDSALLSVLITAVFAVSHGYVHVAELELDANITTYALGFLISTTALLSLGVIMGKVGKSKVKLINSGFGLLCTVVGLTLLIHN